MIFLVWGMDILYHRMNRIAQSNLLPTPWAMSFQARCAMVFTIRKIPLNPQLKIVVFPHLHKEDT
jgi:hypothetical protein